MPRESGMADEDCTEIVDAPLEVAMAEAERQIEKWRATLDWLAER